MFASFIEFPVGVPTWIRCAWSGAWTGEACASLRGSWAVSRVVEPGLELPWKAVGLWGDIRRFLLFVGVTTTLWFVFRMLWRVVRLASAARSLERDMVKA